MKKATIDKLFTATEIVLEAMTVNDIIHEVLYGKPRPENDVYDTAELLKKAYNLKACTKLNNTKKSHSKGWCFSILTQDDHVYTISGKWCMYNLEMIGNIVQNLIKKEEYK